MVSISFGRLNGQLIGQLIGQFIGQLIVQVIGRRIGFILESVSCDFLGDLAIGYFIWDILSVNFLI